MVERQWCDVAKGGQFERDICKRLSVWWQGDADADVCFWRTSQSGGRATTRAKSGKRTNAAHCGDIGALDERGAPLTRLITWELKRGYSAASIHALLDSPITAAPQIYEKWIGQAMTSATAANTPYWAVVHKRNGREITMTVPAQLFDELGLCRILLDAPIVRLTLANTWSKPVTRIPEEFASFHFEAFLEAVNPAEIRRLLPTGMESKC